MKATRSNLPHLIAAAGGVVLVVSLFLSWLSIGDASASGWETFSFVDIVLVVIGIAAAAVGGANATGSALPVAWLTPQVLKWVGVVAVTIVLTFIVEGDNLGFGAFVGLLAAAAILAGAILAERPDLAARVADATGVSDDRPAAQPPAGLGGSASTATPVGSAPPAAAPAPGAAPAGGSEAPTSVQPTTAAGGAGPAASTGGSAGGPPAGWYPDPQGQARLRYWDGGAWTDQTSA